MKGHTKIVLTDTLTGEKKVYEDDNLITKAIDYVMNIELAMNHAPNSYMLPIATRLLGGIMLFDGELSEDVNNVHFPTEAHLVGYAGQGANTTDKYAGTYNSAESGKIENGYVSVWDFGTSQANGTIKAVARTSYHAGSNPLLNFACPARETTSSGNPATDTYWYPIRYDGEYAYLLKGDSNTHLMRLARVRCPSLKFGVADYSNVERVYEVIASWDTEVFSYTYYTNNRRYEYDVTVYADDPIMYEDGQDGFIYCLFGGVQSGRDTDYTYNINYFTIKYSDESYDKSETQRLNTGISSYAYNDAGRHFNRIYGHVNRGKAFILGGTRKTIHVVPLDNPAAFSTIRILSDDSSDYIYHLDYVCPHNGGVYFEVYHYTASSYEIRYGYMYPDGVYLLQEIAPNGTNANHNNSSAYTELRTMDSQLTAFSRCGDVIMCRGWAANYLGTINNLATPIEKTAAQTMKIIYTLTDVEG